jgi:hypothetical protein
MKPSFILRGLCATALLITLAACGGGGDSGASGAANPANASGTTVSDTPAAGNGNGQTPPTDTPPETKPVLSCAP